MKKFIFIGQSGPGTPEECGTIGTHAGEKACRVYRVQLGMYRTREAAEHDAQLLRELGYRAFVI